MKVDIIDNTIRLIPEGETEIAKFNQLFPANYLRTSKVIKSKGFVDQFGNPTGARYLTIRGYEEALVQQETVQDETCSSVDQSQPEAAQA